MGHELTLAEETEPDRETVAAIGGGLDAYNEARAGPEGYTPLWLVARDAAGTVQAGLRGHTFWSWCLVDWLWVAEAYRHQGHGSRLLAQAEAVARNRGCVGAYLDTFSFQAPTFYARHGYVEFGRLDGLPAGHARIWMAKRFATGSG